MQVESIEIEYTCLFWVLQFKTDLPADAKNAYHVHNLSKDLNFYHSSFMYGKLLPNSSKGPTE